LVPPPGVVVEPDGVGVGVGVGVVVGAVTVRVATALAAPSVAVTLYSPGVTAVHTFAVQDAPVALPPVVGTIANVLSFVASKVVPAESTPPVEYVTVPFGRMVSVGGEIVRVVVV
jgi:hypothetical protein